MKNALVLGGNGFMGHHLVRRLKAENYFVRAIGRHKPVYDTLADEYQTGDLRHVSPIDPMFDDIQEVYQFAGEAGGLGYIEDADNDLVILRDNLRINQAVLEACRFRKPMPRVFFASSGCVYPDVGGAVRETQAYPAHPINQFGWEKLYAERLYLAYARQYKLDVRIARFHSTYGPESVWQGDRARAPATLCGKIAAAGPADIITIWGDGTQTRSFMSHHDAVEGTWRLMRSDCTQPLNIGQSETVSINGLVSLIQQIARKPDLRVKTIDGPVGVRGRSSDNTLCRQTLGWEPAVPLRQGLEELYGWVATQALDKAAAAV